MLCIHSTPLLPSHTYIPLLHTYIPLFNPSSPVVQMHVQQWIYHQLAVVEYSCIVCMACTCCTFFAYCDHARTVTQNRQRWTPGGVRRFTPFPRKLQIICQIVSSEIDLTARGTCPLTHVEDQGKRFEFCEQRALYFSKSFHIVQW
jgi:hypothetical protein